MSPATVVDVRMPKLGDTVVDGTIEEWLVGVGDVVPEGTSLLTIATDKVTTEYPSEVAGEIVELLAVEGQTLAIGEVIARISVAQDAPLDVSAPAPTQSQPTTPDRPAPTGSARALAARDGIELAAVEGSGRQGRVRLADVTAASSAAAARPAAPGPATRDRVAPGAPDRASTGRSTHSSMRRAIAEHMMQSWRTNQHASVFAQVDLAGLLELRRQESAAFQARTGVVLTLLPFLVDAFGQVLGAPASIGVAVDVGNGLIVPVVRQAGLGWQKVAVELGELVSAARRSTLQPDQVRGGLSTVTNVGTWGARECHPILNSGQASILGVGAGSPAPVLRENGLSWSTVMPLSLCYDRNRMDEFAAADLVRDLCRAIDASAHRRTA